MLGGRGRSRKRNSTLIESLMQNVELPKQALLKAILRGSFFALAIQSVFTIILLAAQHSGREIALVGLASFVTTTIGGFAVIARHVTVTWAVVIGIVYFPTIFGLMFLEAMVLDARLYGNTY